MENMITKNDYEATLKMASCKMQELQKKYRNKEEYCKYIGLVEDILGTFIRTDLEDSETEYMLNMKVLTNSSRPFCIMFHDHRCHGNLGDDYESGMCQSEVERYKKCKEETVAAVKYLVDTGRIDKVITYLMDVIIPAFMEYRDCDIKSFDF